MLQLRQVQKLISFKRVVGYSLDSNEVSAEVEEYPVLEAITREQMVKIKQAEKT
jgi:hypothetical protein